MLHWASIDPNNIKYSQMTVYVEYRLTINFIIKVTVEDIK